ncbi:MAG: two-component system sensor histidine kinase NtrB [Gemmatimonadota bacterium]
MATPATNSALTPPAAVPAAATSSWRDLPDRRTLLKWLFIGRTAVAVIGLLGFSFVWTRQPDVAFIVSIAVLVSFIATAYGVWRMSTSREEPGLVLIGVQAIADLTLVAVLVHFSGKAQNGATALYVPLVAIYAVLLPVRRSALVATAASALYLAEGLATLGGSAGVTFWAQLGVINVVFAVVAALGTGLRAAAEARISLTSELRRVRLEADDILQNIRSGVLTVDGEGRLAFINPMAARILALKEEEVIGRPVLELLKIRCNELWAAVVDGITKGARVSRGEGWVVGGKGELFPIGLSTTTFERSTGDRPSVTAIFTDISDLKQLQELHLRAERLEAVAALSASLAHEIRNPLAAIRSSVEQLARTKHADEDDRALAALIVRESDRLSRLLSEFLDFSRVRAARFAPVDLHHVVSDAIRLVREHPDCPKEAVLELKGQPTELQGDEDLLHRVVANLLLNAVQAARGPVHVTVTVGAADPATLPKGSRIQLPVKLEVKDNGPGIPPEIRDRLFLPFVSGRPGGSGLGLAIVQRAVEAHRGLVLLQSTPGQGTTFTIYLPARVALETHA